MQISDQQVLALLGPRAPITLASYALSTLSSRPASGARLETRLAPLIADGTLQVDTHRLRWNPVKLHQVTREVIERYPELLVRLKTRLGASGDYQNIVRLAYYLNDLKTVETFGSAVSPGWSAAFLLPEIDYAWVASRLEPLRCLLLRDLFGVLEQLGQMPAELQTMIAAQPPRLLAGPQLRLLLWRGEWAAARTLLASSDLLTKGGYEGVWHYLQGDLEAAWGSWSKLLGKRRSKVPMLNPLAAAFCRLAAMRRDDWVAFSDPRIDLPHDHPLRGILEKAAEVLRTGDSDLYIEDDLVAGYGLTRCFAWSLRGCLPGDFSPAPDVVPRLMADGLKILADQWTATPRHPWAPELARREPWRVGLQGLKVAAAQTPARSRPGVKRPSALAWVLSGSHRLQAFRVDEKSGRRGVELPLDRLAAKPPDFLSEADLVVLSKLERQRLSGHVFVSVGPAALRALVGHPQLFYDEERCELQERQQSLHLHRTPIGLMLGLEPELSGAEGFELRPPQDGTCTFWTRSPEFDTLRGLLHGLPPIPDDATEELREALAPWLGKIEITYGEQVQPVLRSAPADAPLLALLAPERQGLRFSWGFQPLGPDGPAVRVVGGPSQPLHWLGQVYQVRRDPAVDRAQIAGYVERCPQLGSGEERLVSDREEALDLLSGLRQADIPLAWAEGKKWSLSAPVTSRQVSMRAASEGDWFTLQGSVQLDEGLTVELGHLLELIRNQPGRYVTLDDGSFLALTEQVRQQLAALDELVDPQKKGLRLSPLAVPTLADLEFGQLEVDAEFERTLERFASASSYHPPVPAALQAELRDYQVEGFRWMAQRLHAGCGACLADDMGLGKTVQSIALLIAEQRQGASLVVCPTSVTSNWHEQITRFAPSLRPLLYEGRSRAAQLAEAAPGDVIICSYRTLLQDQETLSAQRWNVALLDEAQFIKNPEAKTSRACFSLQARGRVATSGTPVENQLSELWSIFRFLNPGLLGTLAAFRRRFEGSGTRRRLRRLVSPFLLRRTKAEVLSELPPRTELTLEVELSAGERSLYESVRRQAEERTAGASGRFELLAQLTRLRQACCHPALLAPDLKLSSSKLQACLELLHDLRQGNHRALVFSQFTSLLDLLERDLQAGGFDFFRLDGSTPAPERRRLTQAFQAGEAEVFLISLKAGGTGLNLTGADYVVHLDPWWNPAAEDQASDRAHRIGQTRPVTIYRLIARHTIEERVVALHGRKRQLAESVLTGVESTTLSPDELRDLLRDDWEDLEELRAAQANADG